MNIRHAVVLHWKDRSQSSSSMHNSHHHRHGRSERGGNSGGVPRHPLLYVPPVAGLHQEGRELLEGGEDAEGDETEGGGRAAKGAHPARRPRHPSSPGHAGMGLGSCLDEFCREQVLTSGTDSWRCPRCREVREGRQHMIVWRLPDILVFHLKRFNSSARWREKITTLVNFPLTGMDMSEWCDEESPALGARGSEEGCVYDLVGVVNHYGGMTGGHYVATCRATACGPTGSEEVSHCFSGAGVGLDAVDAERSDDAGGGASNGGQGAGGGASAPSSSASTWRPAAPFRSRVGGALGGGSAAAGGSQNGAAGASSLRAAALSASRNYATGSAEPLWLQFDDDLVEPVPPRSVVTETAYVLFYRRRKITPSNVARYGSLE